MQVADDTDHGAADVVAAQVVHAELVGRTPASVGGGVHPKSGNGRHQSQHQYEKGRKAPFQFYGMQRGSLLWCILALLYTISFCL